MKDQLNAFKKETEHLLTELEEHIFELEDNPADTERIDAVFRHLHTIKGAAGMFDYELTAYLAHSLENIFDAVKQQEILIDNEILTLCFDFVEYVRTAFEGNTAESDEKANDIVNKADAIVKFEVEQETDNLKTYRLIFKPDIDFEERGVDLFQFIDFLESNGKIIKYERPVSGEDILSKFYMFWEIFLTAKSESDITEGFLFKDTEVFTEKIADADIITDGDFEEKLNEINQENKIFELDDLIKIAKETVVAPAKPKLKKQAEISKSFMANDNSAIRIEAQKLDDLMNFVSELVTLKERVNIVSETKNADNLAEIAEQLEKITRKIQDNALSMRLVPLKSIITKLELLVRKTAQKQDKKIRFETDGAETELDKTIIDNITEPLIHILRNSIDHGIEPPEERLKNGKDETGRIKLYASYTGDTVIIQIHDDGRGIDIEKIKKTALKKGYVDAKNDFTKQDYLNLIFAPGFTTSDEITDISGRGVGMDVVRTKITELRGELEVDSEAGLGTYITIKLPLTLSIVDTLQIQVNGNNYLIPKYTINKVDEISADEFTTLKNSIISDNDDIIPIINLKEKFGNPEINTEYLQIISVNYKHKKYGLLADKIIGDHQAVLKPLGGMLNEKQNFSGASILGNGSLALMIDTNKLIKFHGR